MMDRSHVQPLSAPAADDKPPLPVRRPGASNPPKPRAAFSVLLAGWSL
ncbi:hypothetical protein AB0P17_04065 [Streptomyces sp. NPDC088124]